ncbi:hypothetical protein TNCV_4943231 [Trichonephila clavipes]|nr:hypothetical protein TNCV_4943231 [Trichonephila clavipes]
MQLFYAVAPAVLPFFKQVLLHFKKRDIGMSFTFLPSSDNNFKTQKHSISNEDDSYRSNDDPFYTLEPVSVSRFIASDEVNFRLNGYVNKQNCPIWSEANPQVYVETPLHPEKLTVWCALCAGGILLQKP